MEKLESVHAAPLTLSHFPSRFYFPGSAAIISAHKPCFLFFFGLRSTPSSRTQNLDFLTSHLLPNCIMSMLQFLVVKNILDL